MTKQEKDLIKEAVCSIALVFCMRWHVDALAEVKTEIINPSERQSEKLLNLCKNLLIVLSTLTGSIMIKNAAPRHQRLTALSNILIYTAAMSTFHVLRFGTKGGLLIAVEAAIDAFAEQTSVLAGARFFSETRSISNNSTLFIQDAARDLTQFTRNLM